jgi:hypothetical protein
MPFDIWPDPGPDSTAFLPGQLVIGEKFKRDADVVHDTRVTKANVSSANLELKRYGLDANKLMISGGTGATPVHLATGSSTAPIAVTLKDDKNCLNLTGLAKIKWQTRASLFHALRPVVKLADGTWLVGDHVDSNTMTFLESEFAFWGLRWVKLDIERVVTIYSPSWIEKPDLSKVDEVGFADLMPGSGDGAGGWVNVGQIEVWGWTVRR